MPYTWAEKELVLDKHYTRGVKGARVKAIQEWLSLQGEKVSIDGDFGPATDRAVRNFQARKGAASGVVDEATFADLTAPLKAALAPIDAAGRTVNDLVLAYAHQHLRQHPREVGGENCGPWVRVYMEGNQGHDWLWCAGFACFMLRQATDSLKIPMPFKRTFSCDTLASQAMATGRFVSEKDIAKGRVSKSDIPPGSLFVCRRSDNDWSHTGIVIACHDDHIETIEGNTNDNGDAEGYEVCQRIRGYQGKDFVKI